MRLVEIPRLLSVSRADSTAAVGPDMTTCDGPLWLAITTPQDGPSAARVISGVAMTAAIAHRGPDSDGFYVSGGVGLGFRRLNQTVSLHDTPAIRGMIFKVRHLVVVEEA